MNQLRKNLDPKTNRDILGRWMKRLKYDGEYYEFTSNKLVIRTSPDVLTLPLNSGPFSAVEAQLASYIESVWSKPGLQLKVQWTQALNPSDLFKLVLGETAGGRSFVSYSNKTVHLFPSVRTKSIAHEIGHVLGFTDNYYTTWKPETCTYFYQSREDDLMSDPETGAVTSEEWAKLTEKYPY